MSATPCARRRLIRDVRRLRIFTMGNIIKLLVAAMTVALQPFAFAGADCIVDGTVHHVSTTENKIVFIVSGECSVVNPTRDGYLKFPIDHGIFVIARRGQPHSADSDAWEALTKQAQSLHSKHAILTSHATPDFISIERFEVFMVRCRVLNYPAEGGTPSIFLSERQNP